ncbi:MAG TPA: hypothetical protein DCO79_01930 [Spirochaeta sp.]|nr:hypothetical protein [Spirochaeta sp.]
MSLHYYLSIFPTEALIASQLGPEQFGAYMATGSKKGSAEQIIFLEVEGGFDSDFDWDYAEEKCVAHPNGNPKHSVYLSVYRTLENIPLEKMGGMYLTTRDGRVLRLEKDIYRESINGRKYYIYQELCPVNPVIVSVLDPEDFSKNITSRDKKVSVPKIVFADMKIPDFDNPEHSGNIGGMYDNKIPHILNCIASVTGDKGKTNKTVDRSHVESFSFQVIENGVYICDDNDILEYKFPEIDVVKEENYYWGRSALLY